MTSQNLFRSLKAQPPAVLSAVADIAKPIELLMKPVATREATPSEAGKVQSILSRSSQHSKWPLLQSVQAFAWDPTPNLSAQEKLNRLAQVGDLANDAYKLPKFRLPEASGKLAEGLRRLGKLDIEASSLIAEPATFIVRESANVVHDQSSAHPAVFRGRASKLFEVSSSNDPMAKFREAKVESALPETSSESLRGIFARLGAGSAPSVSLRDSLRSLSATSVQRK